MVQELQTGNEVTENTEAQVTEQEGKKKTLTLGLGKRLDSKRHGDGHVQQSFTHGRTKTVEVEVKRKKIGSPVDNKSSAQVHDVDLTENLGDEITETILASDEYKEVYEANKLTFDAVDKAKDDSVPASYVDKCNYKRMLAKKELQSKFFNTNLSEIKIGYERHK